MKTASITDVIAGHPRVDMIARAGVDTILLQYTNTILILQTEAAPNFFYYEYAGTNRTS
jgi:hypothetical protein